ncbi:DUF7482 domain-containing protein [Marinomonas colpomeniae]|uniref:DUF7482 domain-containing protein n=1 Tax=Marinomonas colpomeniae TaxID=2774408 RepID=A0ABR8P088_9GAMM|nr:hypothetical protein [Marinomonas colpomeniae]MBD5770838.1 hypothetical protein [Marinomonas colpomeniae]
MLFKSIFAVVLTLLLSACSTVSKPQQVSFTLYHAWYEGGKVGYIITDVSHQDAAKEMNANYAPRLRDAVPRYPKPPQVKTVLERVYGFPNKEQKNNVFASAPSPAGYLSEDRRYSPLWIMYIVKWVDPNQAQELTSEEAIFVAEGEGLITIERTDIVINCPVVPFPVSG